MEANFRSVTSHCREIRFLNAGNTEKKGTGFCNKVQKPILLDHESTMFSDSSERIIPFAIADASSS